MEFWEILIIIVIVTFVVTIFGIRIYKLLSGKPLDECAVCHKKTKKILKEYHKKFGKNKTCCNKK